MGAFGKRALTGDRLLSFSLGARDVRGRIVTLSSTIDAILGAQDHPPWLARLVGELLLLAALLGGLLTEDKGELTLQIVGEDAPDGAPDKAPDGAPGKAPVRLMVADYRAAATGGELRGELRGYGVAGKDENGDKDAAPPAGAGLRACFGAGRLVVTVDDRASGKRYQGIVPLEAPTFAAAAEAYFERSEQLPTIVRLGLVHEDGHWRGGGLLLQPFPGHDGDGEGAGDVADDDWETIAALGGSARAEELAAADLAPEELLWRLFHQEECRLYDDVALARGCRCSLDHIRDVLARFAIADRKDMMNDLGEIVVTCEFCNRAFAVDAFDPLGQPGGKSGFPAARGSA